MKELKPRIHENGMDYVLVGDYYVPDLKLPEGGTPPHWSLGTAAPVLSETVSPDGLQ